MNLIVRIVSADYNAVENGLNGLKSSDDELYIETEDALLEASSLLYNSLYYHCSCPPSGSSSSLTYGLPVLSLHHHRRGSPVINARHARSSSLHPSTDGHHPVYIGANASSRLTSALTSTLTSSTSMPSTTVSRPSSTITSNARSPAITTNCTNSPTQPNLSLISPELLSIYGSTYKIFPDNRVSRRQYIPTLFSNAILPDTRI
uniref:Uncharacterized protein n=1 Tax=Tetranychus urticae TaxID=32264 RepID=T1JRK1_TETUR